MPVRTGLVSRLAPPCPWRAFPVPCSPGLYPENTGVGYSMGVADLSVYERDKFNSILEKAVEQHAGLTDRTGVAPPKPSAWCDQAPHASPTPPPCPGPQRAAPCPVVQLCVFWILDMLSWVWTPRGGSGQEGRTTPVPSAPGREASSGYCSL